MNQIIELATKEIGYVEENGNRTKYGEWFGLNGLPWCGIFVSWVYYFAGFPLPNIGFKKGFAGCQFAYDYFKNMKKLTSNPRAGDIVLYDFDNNGRYDHTGIFVEWTQQKVRFNCIEGNTSTKNQRNGGSVMIRNRSKIRAVFVSVF